PRTQGVEPSGPRPLAWAEEGWPFRPEDSTRGVSDGVAELKQQVRHVLGGKALQPTQTGTRRLRAELGGATSRRRTRPLRRIATRTGRRAPQQSPTHSRRTRPERKLLQTRNRFADFVKGEIRHTRGLSGQGRTGPGTA